MTKAAPDRDPDAPETLAAQGLGWIDATTRAISPPIHVSTTYERDADNQFRSGRIYSRPDNPTYDQPEAVLTALEGGAEAMLFASGMAAATAVFQTLSPGDHVVAPRVMYWSLRNWIVGFARQWGLKLDLVDMSDPTAVAAHMRPGETRLVWVETPGNPLWNITDISAVAEIAHRAGAQLAVDSTAATPVLTRPLALGADLVMHSATKYLAGHGDVLAGALVTARADPAWSDLQLARREEGACLGPVEAYLLLRGMRTLFARVERQSRTALELARRLEPHVAVAYPGLGSHPHHAVAARQMTGGFGGMLSIRTGARDPLEVVRRLRVWVPATSLGGVESLVEHRASVEGPSSPTPRDLLRLSVGLEHVDDLYDDLAAALDVR